MEKSHFYEFGPFRLDSQTCILWAKQQLVPLEPRVAETLLVLVKAKGQVVLKSALIDQVWGKTHLTNESALPRNIYRLRQQLRVHLDGNGCIETIPTHGYRLTLPVIEHWEDPLPCPVAPTAKPAEAAPALLNSAPTAQLYLEFINSQPRWQRARYVFLTIGSLFVLTGVLALRFAPTPELRVARYVALTNDGRDKDGPLLTDDSRVYFSEQGPDGARLASVAIAGGDATIIPCFQCATAYTHDLSPLHSELLVGRVHSSYPNGGELWVVPLFGGAPRRVGNLEDGFARWSPDHRRLAVSRQESLYVSDADGSNPKKIAEVPGMSVWPRWSPDGKTLRFTENTYRNGEVFSSIWEVGADGSNLHRLLDGWDSSHHECCGSWTPDGRFFIFQSSREGRSDLWVLSEKRGLFGTDSGSPVRLSSGLQFSSAAVSADGKQVFAIGKQQRGELVRYDSRIREFVPFLGGPSATWVSFSRSGHTVAYIDYSDLTVWKTNAGGEKTQITFAPLKVDGLSWSPDEKWLALRARTPGKTWGIYLVPSQGGDVQFLMPSEKEHGVPTWSRDGKKIAYGDVPPVFGRGLGTEMIHLFELSSHTVSELSGSEGLWTARWSPDGRTLAALTIAEQRLMLYDFTTKRWRSTKAESINNPTWSTDSRYIYFDTKGDNPALRRIRTADGQVDELVSLNSFPNMASWWSGLAPDNSPIVLRSLATAEIYALTLEPK